MKRIISAGVFFLFCLTVAAFWGSTSCAKKTVKLDITPDELSEKMINNPDLVKHSMGESFCWHARVGIDQYIDNYQLTRDTGWLDAGIKYYDFLIGKMDTDPSGYRGWIGPIRNNEIWSDALVGDAILLTSILDFSVLVLEDETLKGKYGDKANSYVELAKKDFVEKWDKRGCWYEDGPFAAYSGMKLFTIKNNVKEWLPPRRPGPGFSDPFNKQFDAAQVLLRLCRITGDKFYRDKAEKIFFAAKNHFQYFDDHYCWNYWEPLTSGDVDLERKTTRHWVGVHPFRSGYQAGEIYKIVEAYHYGIVFDEQDIRRIINTNLNVMWNKDKVNPRFINSNGLGADNDTTGLGSFRAAHGHSNIAKNTGELWAALLNFDQTIRDLYELRFKDGKNPTEYLTYKNTVLKNPPSFKRKYVTGDVTIPAVDFKESRDLYCAGVLPHAIAKGEKSIIICKSWISGVLQIDLYSTNDKKIKNLYTGKIEGSKDSNDADHNRRGLFIMTWDGKDPDKKETYKGDYKIRWTIGDGCREFPVTIE